MLLAQNGGTFLEDIIDHFRDRRPIVIFLIFFTLIGGVVAGIICVCKHVCDFGTAYRISMYVGTLLTISILGYSRFAGAFRWFNDLVPADDWDPRYPNPMGVIVLIGWLVLVVVVPMIEFFLLPVDIIVTVILSIIDIVDFVRPANDNVKGDTRTKTETAKTDAEDAASVEEPKRDILKITELTDEETQMLCQMVEESAKKLLYDLGRKKKVYRYLGGIILKKSGRNLRLYIVYKVTLSRGKIKDFIFAEYFENVCRKSDGTLDFKDGQPKSDYAWNNILRLKDKPFLDAYPSLEAFCAILPTNCERDSNFIDF